MTRPTLKAVKAAKRPTYALLRQAVRLYRWDLAPRSVRRHNARQWIRAVLLLGPDWILAGRRQVSWGAKERKA